jgi:hypothetical protein
MLLSANKDGERYQSICIPKRLSNPKTFDDKMDKLEQKLLLETLKPF